MATDDDDPPDTPLTDDDRRAKDLDPAQLAELAAWFDLPSAQVYAEQQARVAEESFEEKEWRETRERRDAAAAAADPALIEYISRHETRPPPFKPLPPVQLVIDEKKLVMDLVRRELDRYEREDPLAQEKPFFIPGDITEALVAHNAPQAILRDLYRPVEEYALRFESPFDEVPILDPLRVIREALAERHAVEWLQPPMNALDETRRDFREILSAPWNELAETAKNVRAAGVAQVEEWTAQGR